MLVIKVTVLDDDKCIVDQDTFVPHPSPSEWYEQRRQLALAMKSLLDIMHNGSKQCPFSPEHADHG